MPSVLELSIEDFPSEHRREIGTDAAQLDQLAHLLGARIGGWFAPFDKLVALCFDLPNLLSHQLEAFPFALDLNLQPLRDRLPIACQHPTKTVTPLRICDPECPDAMHDQEPLDTVEVRGALTHQSLPLTMVPLPKAAELR